MEKQTIAHSSSIMSNIVTFFCLLFKLVWIDFAQNCLKFRLLLALAITDDLSIIPYGFGLPQAEQWQWIGSALPQLEKDNKIEHIMRIDHQADPALSILLKSVPFCLSCVKT